MDYVSVTPKLPKTIEKPRVIRKLTWRLVDRVVFTEFDGRVVLLSKGLMINIVL